MKSYLEKDSWKIIESSHHQEYNEVSESITSLGNGRLGGRGNFELKYKGPSLQGSYIAGIYYPDKTKVGWWKNGYPEYFAKVINSVNWIGVDISIDGVEFQLDPDQMSDFHTELDMQTGILSRTITVDIPNGKKLRIVSERFYSMEEKDRCFLRLSLTPLNFTGEITLSPYLDFNVKNKDANYDETFWSSQQENIDKSMGYVHSMTKKTNFHVVAGMKVKSFLNEESIDTISWTSKSGFVSYETKKVVQQNQKFTVEKYCCISSSLYYKKEDLVRQCKNQLTQSIGEGYDLEKQKHISRWAKVWHDSDIVIEGDVAAQQGIRFNIFQLYQTYTGDDDRLNIGPKGFTGEKYGGVTYWDTEAYCLPFYLGTADKTIARNLLTYRYKHLQKAIENAEKLGFKNGAALYPMVTMNGEECHNEWEITFEEIHRNAAIAHAIYNYTNYTGDRSYVSELGLEVLIGIARFWNQRANWSESKQKYVILGVTGPNEYENNVNNNWYTNYAACWCLKYTLAELQKIKQDHSDHYNRIIEKTHFDTTKETEEWQELIDKMYFPYDDEKNVFLQQDGFLDKEIIPAANIPKDEYPIHQHWSWDRILRSCFIKQADVLQGLFFFETEFDVPTIQRNFNFYEPLTVHESSLSPCVHSILAAKIGNYDKAYEMYLRTARLDLDDYNNDTKDGLHITSMAGTWMSIVKGFGGMRIIDGTLSFDPFIPENWSSYSFKLQFRGRTLEICVNQKETTIINLSKEKIDIVSNGNAVTIDPKETQNVE